MSYTEDPNFYCDGQQCIDTGCSPLHCIKQDGPLADREAAMVERITARLYPR